MGIFINTSLTTLAPKTKEIAKDEINGTNNAGIDLFAVLAEVDETGFPLAYLFIEKIGLSEQDMSGNLMQILVQLLKKLRLSKFIPSFMGCDKDKSELNAIQEVSPSTNSQL